MFDFVFDLPSTFVFVSLVFITVFVSVLLVFLVRKHIPVTMRYQDNAGVANTSALISIIYGVLAGLMALFCINNINYASDAVQREANAVANIYRSSQWLAGPIRSKIIDNVKFYLDEVISVEWVALKNGEMPGNKGRVIIDDMMQELSQYNMVTMRDSVIVADILDEIKNLYNAREQRIHLSFSQLSPETWVVILIGSILTIAINFLLGMNFYLHLLTVAFVAIMTSSMVFLLITLDKPFQGDFVVGPSALQAVQKYVEKFDPIKATTT